MSLESRLTEFTEKYDLETDAIADLLKIWNATLVEVAHGLLKDSTVKNSVVKDSVKTPSLKKSIEPESDKKWASKAAAEFALENNLTLDDFTQNKVSKKDIIDHLKAEKKKNKVLKKSSGSGSDSESKKPKKFTGQKCHGLTKKGEPCVGKGTHQPEGSKFMYCFRHADDYKDFELSSDSSDCESEPELKPEKELSDDNLFGSDDDEE